MKTQIKQHERGSGRQDAKRPFDTEGGEGKAEKRQRIGNPAIAKKTNQYRSAAPGSDAFASDIPSPFPQQRWGAQSGKSRRFCSLCCS